MLTKDLAICVRTTDFSETSQIVTFFTRRSGKISAIAKGSKRPKSAFDGPIEMLSHGKIVFSNSTKDKLATLTEFEQQPALTHLANNLFTLNCCLFGAELVNLLTNEYDPHPELFDSFLQFLKNAHEQRATSNSTGRLTAEHRDPLVSLILFQLALLKEIGLRPVLNACANCKTSHERPLLSQGQASDERRATSDEIYFSSSAGGLVCRDCEDSFPDRIRLAKNAADCLANVKLIAQSDEKTLNEIEKVLIYHFTELLHKPPKMAKYVARGS